MGQLTVTSKGQVTLRKDVLEHLGVRPGDKISVDKLADGRVEVRAVRPAGDITSVFNALQHSDRPALSLDEIDDIAAQGWAGKA